MRFILLSIFILFSPVLRAAGPPVFVDKAATSQVQTGTSVAGRLVAGATLTFSAEIAQSIKSVAVRVGDLVPAGTELARLDDATIRDKLKSLTARNEYLSAHLALLKQRKLVRDQQLDRAKSLTSKDLLTRDVTEQAELNVIQTESDIVKATFDIADLVIEIADVQRQLSQTVIKSGSGGRVLEVNVAEGQYVRPGDRLFQLLPSNGIEVEVDVRPEAYDAVKVGQIVKGSLRNLDYDLKVRALIAEQNQRTGSRVIRLLFVKSPKAPMVLGESIDLKLPLGESATQVTISKDAVIPGKSGHRVVVIVDGKVEYRRVELGDGIGDRIVALKGVKAGDVLVTQGQDGLRKGQEVTIVSEKS